MNFNFLRKIQIFSALRRAKTFSARDVEREFHSAHQPQESGEKSFLRRHSKEEKNVSLLLQAAKPSKHHRRTKDALEVPFVSLLVNKILERGEKLFSSSLALAVEDSRAPIQLVNSATPEV